MLVMVVAAVVLVTVLIRSNFINCMVGGVCGIVSGGGVRHGCSGSSFVQHHLH